jgi:hypothetical protein
MKTRKSGCWNFGTHLGGKNLAIFMRDDQKQQIAKNADFFTNPLLTKLKFLRNERKI